MTRAGHEHSNPKRGVFCCDVGFEPTEAHERIVLRSAPGADPVWLDVPTSKGRQWQDPPGIIVP